MTELHDLSCVVHVHSLHSDGTGTVPEIAAAAQKGGADVVLVTDHDSLGAARHGEEGWHGRVLILAGHEITPPNRNHMLAFGLEREVEHEGRGPAEIAAAVRERGGLGIAAHPFSEGSDRFSWLSSLGISMCWEEPDVVDGLEVWSFISDNGQSLESFRAAARFIVRPERHVTHPPARNLREWDRLGRARRVVGVGGLDAHQFGRRVGGRVLRLMGYARTFRQLRTHVLTREPLNGELAHDRDQVLGALSAGRCYVAAHAFAPARGFRFGAESVEMGSEAPAGEHELHARAPRPAALTLLRDGRPVAAAAPPATELSARVSEPGVYRVEARLVTHGVERTWILSNPIYLRQVH